MGKLLVMADIEGKMLRHPARLALAKLGLG